MALTPDVPGRPNRLQPVVSYRPAGEPSARTPEAFSAFGMWLFLVALFILFAAMLLAYLLIRIGSQKSPPLHTIEIPWLMFLGSTGMVLGVSLAMGLAVHHIRRAHLRQLREMLLASLVLAVGFVLIQTPAMVRLLRFHHAAEHDGIFTYGLVFFLVLVHALHVAGGLIAILWVVYRAGQGIYTQTNYSTIRNTALYWHFLDLIWICMFLMFLATG